jgi:hypothetical protein
MLVFGKAIGGFSGRSTPHISVTPVTGPFFSALLYRCKLNVDWDGAPTAYGKDRPDTASHQFPLQKNLKPWERPANNGSLQDARADSDGHLGRCVFGYGKESSEDSGRQPSGLQPAQAE